MLVRVLFKSTRGKSYVPPSPFSIPIIGHLYLISPKPHQDFHKLSIRYGPVFRLFLGSLPCVVVSSSQTAKELFKTYDGSFLDRPYNSSMDYISYGGNGFIFATYGPYWKFLKKFVMSELLNGKTLDSLHPVRRDEINRFIRYLSQKAKNGKEVELEPELMKLTNNVISRMIMGKSCLEEEAGDARKIVSDIGEVMGTFNLSDHIWFLKNLDLQGVRKRSKEIRERFDALIENILNEHEAKRMQKDIGKVKDLLDILLGLAV